MVTGLSSPGYSQHVGEREPWEKREHPPWWAASPPLGARWTWTAPPRPSQQLPGLQSTGLLCGGEVPPVLSPYLINVITDVMTPSVKKRDSWP